MWEDQTQKMEAEPMVIDQDGNISDASEHSAMLDNEDASARFSQLAYQTGKKLGFSDEQLREIFSAQ